MREFRAARSAESPRAGAGGGSTGGWIMAAPLTLPEDAWQRGCCGGIPRFEGVAEDAGLDPSVDTNEGGRYTVRRHYIGEGWDWFKMIKAGKAEAGNAGVQLAKE